MPVGSTPIAPGISRVVNLPFPSRTKPCSPGAAEYQPVMWPKALIPCGVVLAAPGTAIEVSSLLRTIKTPWGGLLSAKPATISVSSLMSRRSVVPKSLVEFGRSRLMNEKHGRSADRAPVANSTTSRAGKPRKAHGGPPHVRGSVDTERNRRRLAVRAGRVYSVDRFAGAVGSYGNFQLFASKSWLVVVTNDLGKS